MNTSIKSIRHHLGKGSMLFMAVLVAATVAPQIIGIRVAHADTGGYPWSGAACANSGSQLGKTTGTGYWCTNYNWGESTCPSGDGYCTSGWLLNGYYLLDDWGYGFRNCTSYAAWKIKQVFGVSNITGWGNASTWDTGIAPPNGHLQPYTVYAASGHTPQQGEIAQWGTEVAGGVGHVSYVGSLDPPTHIATLWDYNQPQDGTFSSTNTTASGSEGTPDHYIHIGTVSSGTSSRFALTNGGGGL